MLFNIYISLLTAATLSAFLFKHYNPSYRWFGIALALLLFSELLILLVRERIPFVGPMVYHFNIPIYLVLVSIFFRSHIHELIVRQFLLITLVAYSIMSLTLSVFFYSLSDFPGIQLNVMGIIIIGLCLYVLLTLRPINNIPIYKHPMAWICLGYIVFFSATFFLNGIYNRLVEIDSPLRAKIHLYINTIANCFMYSCFIIGLCFSNFLVRTNKKTDGA